MANWPTSQDYNEAVQNAGTSFADAALKSGAVALNALGLPLPRSGNFADVYQFKGGDGKMWAIKCFTRKVDGLRERYLKIDAHLTKVRLPFTVGFNFFEQGIRVRGQWFPIVKMEWVEGFTLNEFVRDNADKPHVLQALLQMWAKLAGRLRDAELAHADLQHGNVLLVPDEAQNKLGLKLIDYDGMWAPALADKHSGEIGHPNFQHPLRIRDRLYSADVDRFPHLAVACALRATILGGRALWDKFDNGDNLLFKEADLRHPAGAPIFAELWGLRDDTLRALLGALALAAGEPLRRTPWLDDVLVADGSARLSAADERKALDLMSAPSQFTAVEPAKTARTAAASGAKARWKSQLPYFIGGGLAACVIGYLLADALNGNNGNRAPKPGAVDAKDAPAAVAAAASDKTVVPQLPAKQAPPSTRNEQPSPPAAKKSEPPNAGIEQLNPPAETETIPFPKEKKQPEIDVGKIPPPVAKTESNAVDQFFVQPDRWEELGGSWRFDGAAISGKTSNASDALLYSKARYRDFELSFQARLTDGLGRCGVRFRSKLDKSTWMKASGPRADMGLFFDQPIWGELYVNGRSASKGVPGPLLVLKRLTEPANVKTADFNDFWIKVVGAKVTIKVNGVVAIDQEFPTIPGAGIIGFEFDGRRPMEATFRDIVFKSLSDPKDLDGPELAKNEAPRSEPKKQAFTYLAEMEESGVQVAHPGWFSKKGLITILDARDRPMLFSGKECPKSIFMHPPRNGFSRVFFQLDKSYGRLKAIAAIPKVSEHMGQRDAVTPLIFEVLSNGKSLWRSAPLSRVEQNDVCEIPLRGVKKLELRVNCQGSDVWAISAWIEPKLLLEDSP
jgi:hypothetical protein